jgi:hypothetical protein
LPFLASTIHTPVSFPFFTLKQKMPLILFTNSAPFCYITIINIHESSRSGTDLFELAVNQSEHFVGFEVSGSGGRCVDGNLPVAWF